MEVLDYYAVLRNDPSRYLYRVRAIRRKHTHPHGDEGPPVYTTQIQLASIIMGDTWFDVGEDVSLFSPLELLAEQAE